MTRLPRVDSRLFARSSGYAENIATLIRRCYSDAQDKIVLEDLAFGRRAVRKADRDWEHSMLSAEQCKEFAANCARLGMQPNISVRRADILMAMSRSWTTLATQIERYEALVKEEDK